jgi:hypothetical protein
MNNLQLTELQPLIIEWAKNKSLVFPENAPKQRLKLIEECGELAQAILKNDVQLQKDAVGDIFVVLVILAEQIGNEIDFNFAEFYEDVYEDLNLEFAFQFLFEYSFPINNCDLQYGMLKLKDISKLLNLDITECANIAWNEIKNRTGQTVNGTFIKDENYDFPNIPGSEPTNH